MKRWILVIAFVSILSLWQQRGASGQQRELCDWLKDSLLGASAEWVGYEKGGWTGYSSDAYLIENIWLIDPTQLPKDEIQFRAQARLAQLVYVPSSDVLFLFIYNSLSWTTDAQGRHEGTHDFCTVRAYPLGN